VYEQDVSPAPRPDAGKGEAVKDGAREVAGTVKEQGREVAREARHQVRSVASDLRGSVTGQAHTQNRRLAGGLRQVSDQFGQMDDGSPAGQVVRRLGEGGRRAADYLEDRGPEGLLEDVQEYARRKPGTFLLIAAVAGFAAGRLGRAAFAATKDEKDGAPDAYREGDGLYRSRSATENYPSALYAPETTSVTPVAPVSPPLAEPMPPAPTYPPETPR
jgi:hypothetical protein